MFAIAKLHNFCINERLLSSQQARQVRDGQQMIFTRHEAMLRDESALEQFEELAVGYENAWSNNRERMVREIEALKLTRPGMSARQPRQVLAST
jgi:phosphoenolpyruvate-protein kinase (PTS system EI component)